VDCLIHKKRKKNKKNEVENMKVKINDKYMLIIYFLWEIILYIIKLYENLYYYKIYNRKER